MAATSSKGRASPARRRLWMMFAGALLVIGVVAGLLARSDTAPPPIPEVDLGAMEPQVAQKMASSIEAVQDEPESGEAWGQLAQVLQAHGLDREAAECYAKATALSPGEFRWHYLLIHALRSFDADRALEQSARAIAVDPDYSPAHVVRAELLEQRNETDAALAHYEKALALDETSAIAAFGVGRLRMAQGETEEALELLRRAVELDPEAGAIHASLAQAYRRAGDREKAALEAQLAFEKKSAVAITDPIHFAMRQESVSSLAQLDRAMQAFDAGDFARAEGIYRNLVKLRPEDADMAARLGDALANQNKIAPAIAQYRAALAINPEQASALYGLGNMMNIEGNYDEALRLYQQSLANRPDHVPTLVNHGSLLAFRGDFRAAEESFRKAAELEPTAFAPQRQLGELLLREERLDEAIERLSAALDIEPDHGPVHLRLSIAYAAAGRVEQALEHAQKAQALGETVPPDFLARLRQGAGQS